MKVVSKETMPHNVLDADPTGNLDEFDDISLLCGGYRMPFTGSGEVPSS